MGTARWNPDDWTRYSQGIRGLTRAQTFRARGLAERLDPARIALRESRDSDLNPASTPIVVAVDVTGSMGVLAEALVKRGLGPLFEQILARRPVSDPHVLAMAVGDAWCDRAPLQVTQFEADLTIAGQIRDLFLEGGGGGNRFESYNLPWYFAATRTATDAWEKRRRKGYLFTVGDEPPPPALLAEHVRQFLGGGVQDDLPTPEVLALAEATWEVFHVVVEQGHYFRRAPDHVMRLWTGLLGERVLPLADHERLAEVIVSAIQVAEGASPDAVAASWDGETGGTVARAVAGLAPLPRFRAPAPRRPGGGVVRF